MEIQSDAIIYRFLAVNNLPYTCLSVWFSSMFQSEVDLFLKPLATDPPVEHVQASLRLVVGHHVASSVNTHEGQVAGALDGTNLAAVRKERKVLERRLLVVLVAGPLKLVGPGQVAEPVADEVGVTGVDQDGNLRENAGNKTVEGLHPVTLEQEVAVDVHVAGGVVADLSAKGLHDVGTVEVLLNPVELVVAEVAAGALGADVVGVHASALVGTDHSVVTVDGGGNARPDTLTVVARLNELLAARKGVVHSLALLLVKDSGPATIAASHGAVVLVLSKTVSQTVTDQNRL